MLEGVDHVGIAVADLEPAISHYTALCGIGPSGRERVESDGVEVVMFDLGTSRIELLAPTHDGSPIAKSLAKRGPGLHHIAYLVTDIESELTRLRASGVQSIDEKPRRGAGGRSILFLHPKSLDGVLTELCEISYE